MLFESARIEWHEFLSISDHRLDGEHQDLILTLHGLTAMAEGLACDLRTVQGGLDGYLRALVAHNCFEDVAFSALEESDRLRSLESRLALHRSAAMQVADFAHLPSPIAARLCTTGLYLDLVDQILSQDMKMKTVFEKRQGR